MVYSLIIQIYVIFLKINNVENFNEKKTEN